MNSNLPPSFPDSSDNDWLRDSTRLYRLEIKRHARLKRTEVEQLVQQMHDSSDAELARQAYQRLIEANLRYVVTVAKRYAGLGIDLLDLIQEGNMALLMALPKYKPERGSLTTYVSWWIRRDLLKMIATQAYVVRLPLYKKEELQRLKRVQAMLAQLEQETTPAVLAEQLTLSERQVADLLAVQTDYGATTSLDQPLDDSDENHTLAELVEDDPKYAPESETFEHFIQERIRLLLQMLTPEEKRIIIRRYGLDGYPVESQLAIARRKGVSHEAIRQTEQRALKKLAPLCSDLKVFLEAF